MKAHQDNPSEGKDQVSDQVKFNVFQGIMDSLFESFNASISVTSFQELSACVFSWIEEHCKPHVSTANTGGLMQGQRVLCTAAPSWSAGPCAIFLSPGATFLSPVWLTLDWGMGARVPLIPSFLLNWFGSESQTVKNRA